MYTNEQLKSQLLSLKKKCITTILALAKSIPTSAIAVSENIIYDSFTTPNGEMFWEYITVINVKDKTVTIFSMHGDQPVPLIDLKINLLLELVEYMEKATKLVR